MGPPPLHPSLPARPTSSRPLNPPPSAPPTLSSNVYNPPLSLPNRPTPSPSLVNPTRPNFNSSASTSSTSFSTSLHHPPASSPKLPASSTTTTGNHHNIPGEAPWPRVRDRLRSDQVKVNSELIEIGQGWSVRWKCWKGTPIALSQSSASSSSRGGNSTNDPLGSSTLSEPPPPLASRPTLASSTSSSSLNPHSTKGKGKAGDGPPLKKKSRPSTAFDELVSHDLPPPSPSLSTLTTAPLSLPATPLATYPLQTRTDASTSKLDEQLQVLKANRINQDEDAFELARIDLVRRGKELVGEGGEHFDLVSCVRMTTTSIPKRDGADVKGKGKAKEVEPDKVEAAGRMLWAFSLVQYDEGETTKENRLDEIEYPNLECVSSGSFNHRSLFPALYPPSSTPKSYLGASDVSPLSRPASSYPHVLPLSSAFYSPKSTSPNQTRPSDLATAYQTFISTLEDVLMTEMMYSTTANGGDRSRWKRIDRSILHVPSPSTCSYDFNLPSSPASPHRRSQPFATLATLRTTLQLSTISVQTRIEEVPYRPLPNDQSLSPPLGFPLLLSPLGLKATFIRRILTESKGLDKLKKKWQDRIESSGYELEGNEWIVCRLGEDVDSTTSSISSNELIWPVELALLDGTRPSPPPSPQTSPDQPTSTELAPDPLSTSSSRPFTSPIIKSTIADRPILTSQESLVSIIASRRNRPSRNLAPPYDSDHRRRLSNKFLVERNERKNQGQEDSNDHHHVTTTQSRRDPLSKRTNEVWSWMEDEVARQFREAEERAEQERRIREEEEEEERKKVEQEEKDRKAAASVAQANSTSTSTTMKRNQPPAGAPINMRTPMSLGTASTEAPSPADVVFPLPGYTTAMHSTQPTSSNGANGVNGKEASSTSMEIDGLGLGLYPSPDEGPQTTPIVGPSAASTQPMSSLDNAFASFDWGDGSFGTSDVAMNANASTQEYDDGMNLLGLTDDDFSFFDSAPTPLPGTTLAPSTTMGTAMAHDPFAALPSTTTSPRFVDHFSHLATTPYTSMASPTSPFAVHSSPHFPTHSSPMMHPYPFNFDSNASTYAVAPVNPAQVLPAPTTTIDALPPVSIPSPPLKDPTPPVPSFDVHLIPSSPSPTSRTTLTRLPFPDAFEALRFSPSYSTASEKYETRRGKFGLPTPDSDDGETSLPNVDLQVFRKPLQKRSTSKDRNDSLLPWYTSVCDPRLAVAGRLRDVKRRRRSSSSRGRRGSSVMQPRGWKRTIVDGQGEEGSDHTATADEDSASESEMKVEEEESSRERERNDGLSGTTVDEPAHIDESLGLALLHLGELARPVVEKASPSPPVLVESSAILNARDVLVSLLADHISYSPDFRALLPEFVGGANMESKLLPPEVIESISTSLSTVCADLSPSPLFADHSTHPPLETATPSMLCLRSQQSILETGTSAVDFWKPMGFEPILGRKDVSAFVIYEEGGTEMHEMVDEWLKLVGTAYHSSRLGDHSHGILASSTHFGGSQDGHLVLPSGSLSRGFSKEDTKWLTTAINEIAKIYQNVVLYLISPEHSAPLAPTTPMFTLLHLLSRNKPAFSTIVSCPVLASQLCLSPPQRSKSERLVSLAFSIYDQLCIPVAKLRFPAPETFPSAVFAAAATQGPNLQKFQSPAITLSPHRSRKITFDMNFPVSTLSVPDRHRFLHLGYSSKPGNAEGTLDWIYLSTIDDSGESWRVISKLIKVHAGMPADVARVRILWSMIRTLLDVTDVEWRLVICKLGEPTFLEIRAWDSLLKEQLTNLRRPLHATFVYADLDCPLAIRPAPVEYRRSSVQSDTISEEGELSVISSHSTSTGKGDTPALFDNEASVFVFTPSEPIVVSTSTLVAPASTYLVHVPRIPTMTHSSSSHDPSSTSTLPAPVSIYGVHFLLSHATRSSTYTATLSELVKDVGQSFTELASLGKVRWKTNGRLAWHLEAVRSLQELEERIARTQQQSSSPPPSTE